MYGFAITVDGHVVYACSSFERFCLEGRRRFATVVNAKFHLISAGQLSAGFPA